MYIIIKRKGKSNVEIPTMKIVHKDKELLEYITIIIENEYKLIGVIKL